MKKLEKYARIIESDDVIVVCPDCDAWNEIKVVTPTYLFPCKRCNATITAKRHVGIKRHYAFIPGKE